MRDFRMPVFCGRIERSTAGSSLVRASSSADSFALIPFFPENSVGN